MELYKWIVKNHSHLASRPQASSFSPYARSSGCSPRAGQGIFTTFNMADKSFSDAGIKEKGDVEVVSEEGTGPIHHKTADTEPERAIVERYGFLGPYISKLFELGVEARGVERIPEDMRDVTHIWNKYVSLL